jgi:hypothetical protein
MSELTMGYLAGAVATALVAGFFILRLLRRVAPTTVWTWDDRLVALADGLADNQVLIALAGYAWHLVEQIGTRRGIVVPLASAQKLALFLFTCRNEYRRMRGVAMSPEAETFLERAAAIISRRAKGDHPEAAS